MAKSDGRYRGSRTPRLRPPVCRFAHPSYSGSLRHLACRLGSLFEVPRTLHTVLSNVLSRSGEAKAGAFAYIIRQAKAGAFAYIVRQLDHLEDLSRIHDVIGVDRLLDCTHDAHRFAVLGDQKVEFAAADPVLA